MCDNSALLGHANRELSERRSVDLTIFKAEYIDLCSGETSITKLIFGDEFNNQIIELKKSNSITKNPFRSNDSRVSYRGRSDESSRRSYSNYNINYGNNSYHSSTQFFFLRQEFTFSKENKLQCAQQGGELISTLLETSSEMVRNECQIISIIKMYIASKVKNFEAG